MGTRSDKSGNGKRFLELELKYVEEGGMAVNVGKGMKDDGQICISLLHHKLSMVV